MDETPQCECGKDLHRKDGEWYCPRGHAQPPMNPKTSSKEQTNMNPIYTKEELEIVRLKNILEAMWGVVCNVSGGDWEKQSVEWREAAERVREEYFAPSPHIPKL